MTGSEATLLAIIFGLGVFAVIVAVGWRSVQNRRILRLQSANGKETIIVAGESDEISSVATTETNRVERDPAHADVVVSGGGAERVPVAAIDRRAAGSRQAAEVEADVSGRDRLNRMVSAHK